MDVDTDTQNVKRKGRGFRDRDAEDKYEGGNGKFESLETTGTSGPAKSIEGWIVIITGTFWNDCNRHTERKLRIIV